MKLVLIFILFFNSMLLSKVYAQSEPQKFLTKEDLNHWKSDTLGCEGLRARVFKKYFKARTEAENYFLKGKKLNMILCAFGEPNEQNLDDDGRITALVYYLNKRSCGYGNIEMSLDILFKENIVTSHWVDIE